MPAPRGLVQQFDQYLHGSRLLKPKQRLLIACSGGADSIALLRLLQSVNQSNYWQWKLVVGHVNHGLRGRHSLADERFVRKTARALGLPCAVKRIRLKRHATDHVSEAAARTARLDALYNLARRHRCAAIVLAHHADDQAETVLMRILRGCGITGLGGMRPRRKLASLHLIRPVLNFERSSLRSYLRDLGQTWREDHTNAAPHYLRNRIRLELLPALETYQPAIRGALARLATQAQQSTRAHRREVAALAPRAVRIQRKVAVFDRPVIGRQPRIIAGMLLRRVIAELGGSLNKVTAAGIGRAVDALRHAPSGAQIQLGDGFTLHIQRQTAALRRDAAKKRRRQSKRKGR